MISEKSTYRIKNSQEYDKSFTNSEYFVYNLTNSITIHYRRVNFNEIKLEHLKHAHTFQVDDILKMQHVYNNASREQMHYF